MSFKESKPLFITLLFFLSSSAIAQKRDTLPSYKSFIYYAELGGAAAAYSINTEYVFKKVRNLNIGARIGFGTYRTTDPNGQRLTFVGIPVGIHAFKNLSLKSHLEIGMDLSYVQGLRAFMEENKTLVLVPNIGYRFQRSQGGVVLKALYTPMFALHEYTNTPFRGSNPDGSSRSMNHWIGLSIGYGFSMK